MSFAHTKTESKKLPKSTFLNVALSLALGAIGGAIFSFLALPLPWMLGAMATTSIAAALGKPITMDHRLRLIMIAIIGVLLGSTLNPSMLSQIPQWLTSLAVLTIFLGVLGVTIPWILRRAGYDAATAYFSALPAGLTEMTIVGTENGGNGNIIALTHTVRVLLVAFIIPFTIVVLLGYERPDAAGPPISALEYLDIILLSACALVGLWLGNKFNMPAGALAAPLALSATIHLAGLTASSPPGALISIAQVVLGTSVGARFSGITLATTGRTILLSFIITLGMLSLSGFIAFVVGPLIQVDPMALLLSLSPGGVTEMSLMALALSQDTAFVTTHHVARIALIIIVGPTIFVVMRRIRKTDMRSPTKKNQE